MASLDNYRIGFIGLGLMGRPMCLNLHRAGARLVIYNRSRAVVDNLIREAIEPADNPADVACRTEIVVLMVSDTPAVKQVLFGDNGLADGLRPGALVIDMGTTAVAATREYAARLAQTGVDFIDAPVSGGEIGARDGSLAIMAGGSEAEAAVAAGRRRLSSGEDW